MLDNIGVSQSINVKVCLFIKIFMYIVKYYMHIKYLHSHFILASDYQPVNWLDHSLFLLYRWVTRNPRQFSATAEESTETSEAEKQLQEQITTLTKENETLTEKVADLQVNLLI